MSKIDPSLLSTYFQCAVVEFIVCHPDALTELYGATVSAVKLDTCNL